MATTPQQPQNKPTAAPVAAAPVANPQQPQTAPAAQAPAPQAPAQNPAAQPAQPQAAPAQSKALVQKPKQKLNMLLAKADWLFLLACLIAVAQTVVLVLLENEKNAYTALQREDADRVYILQKASSVTPEDLEILEKAFLDEKDVISFIQTLETSRPMFDEFELAFTSDVPEGKDVHYLSFTITAVANRQTIVSFIDKLLGSTYAVEATALTIDEAEDDATKANLLLLGNLYIKNGK